MAASWTLCADADTIYLHRESVFCKMNRLSGEFADNPSNSDLGKDKFMSSELLKRTLGRTGLEVTQLGYGAMELRGRREEVTDAVAEEVLNAVLDMGITFIDTSPDYGISEERIGTFINHRRDQFFLSTKCGCNITYPEGVRKDPNHLWTGEVIRRNIEKSLERLKTDHVDILQMHNPSYEDVVENGLVDVLQEIRASGSTRFIGVSSTAPNLMRFVGMGVFDTFQIPYSALERRHETMIQAAADAGAGVIIRGGVAKGHLESGERWAKWDKAGLDELLDGMNRYEFVLRYTLTHPSCNTTIVGTADIEHLRSNIATAKKGPLRLSG